MKAGDLEAIADEMEAKNRAHLWLSRSTSWAAIEALRAAAPLFDRVAALEAELARVKHALAADTVGGIADRLYQVADWYNPADDYLTAAAFVLAKSSTGPIQWSWSL